MDLDFDTAYFMQHGKYPPPRERTKTVPPEGDWEKMHEPDQYICWQGKWISDSMQAIAY